MYAPNPPPQQQQQPYSEYGGGLPNGQGGVPEPAMDGNPFDGGGPPEMAPDPWAASPYGAPSSTGPYAPYGGEPSYGAPGAAYPQPPPEPYGAGAAYPPPPPEPYGAPAAAYPQPPPEPAHDGAIVPLVTSSNQPYYMPPTGGPYGPPTGGPYGGPPPPPQYSAAASYQPPPPPPVDPFSVFESSTVVSQPRDVALVPAPTVPAVVPDEDFWGSFSNQPAPSPPTKDHDAPSRDEKKADDRGSGGDSLPPGGEWYDAKIFTPTLGVMFFKPQELTDSLFLNTDRATIVDALGDRPVVAFIVEGSSARSAGVELGHVLLKVNGVDVKNPKDASRLIKEGPRPLPLLFYVPNSEVVVAEGEHMVKYDTRDTTAPNSAKDWKPKYVVIGGIIAQPWMMNMYRSKVRRTAPRRVLGLFRSSRVLLTPTFLYVSFTLSPNTTLP
jgi:hypothetical protein